MSEDDPLTHYHYSDRLVRLETKVDALITTLADVKAAFDKYVTHERFRPTELLAYGLTSLLLVAVVSAIIATVLPGIMHR